MGNGADDSKSLKEKLEGFRSQKIALQRELRLLRSMIKSYTQEAQVAAKTRTRSERAEIARAEARRFSGPNAPIAPPARSGRSQAATGASSAGASGAAQSSVQQSSASARSGGPRDRVGEPRVSGQQRQQEQPLLGIAELQRRERGLQRQERELQQRRDRERSRVRELREHPKAPYTGKKPSSPPLLSRGSVVFQGSGASTSTGGPSSSSARPEQGGGRLDLNDLDLYGDEDLFLEEEDDLLAEEDLASGDELDELFRTPSEDDGAEVLSGAGASASGGPAGNSLEPGTVSDNNIGEATASGGEATAVGGASGGSQLAAGSAQVKQEAEASAEVDPDDI